MKLKKTKLKNFRCYRDETSICLSNLTALIAKNDIGKSTILEAMNAFFNLEKLDSGDRTAGLANSENIDITCIFEGIPEELIIDTDNLISPYNEYLLNQNKQLEIKRVFSGATPTCGSIYINACHPTASKFDDLFSLNLTQLKARARELDIDLNNVNQTVKSAIRHAIWTSIPNDDLLIELVDLEIQSTIWKPIKNILPLFQLFKSDRPSSDQDAEAQDPIKYAIKAALAQKNAELKKISDYVENQVKEVTSLTIEKIRDMDPDLANQLDPKFSSFNWSKVFSVSLTGEDQIPLNKRGSGVRRLFLINFFRAKTEQLADARDVQNVIFAIEEPETSQHPNSQLLLLDALKDLSLQDGVQVIFTTHNPVLTSRLDLNSIRYIQCDQDGRRCIPANNEQTLQKIRDSLGMFANHNIKVFVGVEGPNDIQYLNKISATLSPVNTHIKDLTLAESAGELVYIPMGGSTLGLWTNRLEGLDVAEIHILDRDIAPPEPAKYQDASDAVNARGDNCKSFITAKREMENYIHFDAINKEFNLQLSAGFEDFDDVPLLVAKAVHEASESEYEWNDICEKKRSKKVSRTKRRLNRGATEQMTSDQIKEIDPNGEVCSWLLKISTYLT